MREQEKEEGLNWNGPLYQLKQENDKLTKLLADPHPGLFTWCGAVGTTVTKMAKIIGWRKLEL